ncbi:family 43 glycosylhydrolase [bacterium]|nr:family 43 glycosylhydrolase [bacterium]
MNDLPALIRKLFAIGLHAAILIFGSKVQLDGATTGVTYTNPVGGSITMGDPFMLVHDREFFLYGTTAVNEGFKCWSSTNLVNWTSHGFAYRKSAQSWGGNTFWAPEVVAYRGRFYMVFSCQPATNKTFSARICLAVADRPEGPFEDLHAPLFDNGWSCIDGHLFVDTDATPYLFFDKVGVIQTPKKRYLSGVVYGVKLKSNLSGIEGEPVLCSQADQPWETPEDGRSICNEGSFVFKMGKTYYLTYSANHYAEPFYGIGYATASSPLGPWKKSPDNPLVHQVPSLGVSGPGHNCVIKSPDGTELFMVYHTHADPAKPGGQRVVNIDRLIVQPDGRLKLLGPTRSPQPLPSGL